MIDFLIGVWVVNSLLITVLLVKAINGITVDFGKDKVQL